MILHQESDPKSDRRIQTFTDLTKETKARLASSAAQAEGPGDRTAVDSRVARFVEASGPEAYRQA
ncbi:hypothetical protein ACP26L_11570 [Paenibacillus sp. S-38]|uniref:hypothetical protein n=1 Tax=Paenibacillus sp. S-38 TaxID=3416710 RepID=UPI003CF897CA